MAIKVTPAGTPRATTPTRVDVPKRLIPMVRGKAPAENLGNLVLPTGETLTAGGMEQGTWMIYGKKRVGKSSLASQFPGAIVFAFEPASQRVAANRVFCPSWAHFLHYINLLKTTKHSFQVAVIDTGYEAYQRCLEDVCKKEGVAHPSESNSGWGKAWAAVSAEFRRAHIELAGTGLGLVVVCHDKDMECVTRAGQKFNMVVPKLSSQADDYYRAVIENVIYYHYRDRQHWLTLRGSDFIFAGVVGDQQSKAFMTPEGKPIYAVYAGETAQEAFINLTKAFNCEQEDSYENETELFEEKALEEAVRAKALKKPGFGK